MKLAFPIRVHMKLAGRLRRMLQRGPSTPPAEAEAHAAPTVYFLSNFRHCLFIHWFINSSIYSVFSFSGGMLERLRPSLFYDALHQAGIHRSATISRGLKCKFEKMALGPKWLQPEYLKQLSVSKACEEKVENTMLNERGPYSLDFGA